MAPEEYGVGQGASRSWDRRRKEAERGSACGRRALAQESLPDESHALGSFCLRRWPSIQSLDEQLSSFPVFRLHWWDIWSALGSLKKQEYPIG